MSQRTRRSVLALGIGAAGALAGCIGSSPGAGTETPAETPTDDSTPGDDSTPTDTSDPSEPASLSFDHAERIHRLRAGFPQRDVADYYLALLRSDDHASAFPTRTFDHEAAEQFLERTDFSRSVVVVLQDRKGSSHPDLTLRETGRDGRQVTVTAEYPGGAATGDITTDTLLVRVPTDEPVRGVRATIHPMSGDPDRLSTANVYDVVPEFGEAGDLVLQNGDCTEHSLSVTVTYQGDLFFREHLSLGPGTRHRVGDLVTHAGEWTVTARLDGESQEKTWNLNDTPPGDVMADVAGDGTLSLSHHPAGIPEATPETCETDGLPYESSTPSENLDHPIPLWVIDRGEAASRLTVTIRDGETQVFRRTFGTTAGYDKIRQAGLLAKKTDYTVSVTTEDGRSTTATVTLETGADELVVRVTETGELAVSLA